MDLYIKNFSLMAIILFSLLSSLFWTAAGDSASSDSGAANESIDAASADGLQNATIAERKGPDGGASPASASAQGLWKATLGDQEVIMAVNQSNQSLFGLAKHEGDLPWNAALAGFISQDGIFISLAAMPEEAAVSTSIRADMEGESMNGFFVRSDSSGKASRGQFSATLISPDTAGYAPAVVETSPAISALKGSAAPRNESAPGLVVGEPSAVVKEESRFKDVTKLAKGINPNIMPRMAPL